MAVCIEKKLTLTGKVFLFECELLRLKKEFGLLKYIIKRDYDVGAVKLHSGDVTYALYWTDRPYTLYVWHLRGNRVNYYFNIADSVSLSPVEFAWRDLVVDILVDADQNCTFLMKMNCRKLFRSNFRPSFLTQKKQYCGITRRSCGKPVRYWILYLRSSDKTHPARRFRRLSCLLLYFRL